MTALSSFNTSMTAFVDNEYGMGMEAVYTPLSLIPFDIRVVRQSVSNKYNQRKIESDTIADHEIFLIKLSSKPQKNETVTLDGVVHYVDYFENVSTETYRIFVISESQTVPSLNNRQEI